MFWNPRACGYSRSRGREATHVWMRLAQDVSIASRRPHFGWYHLPALNEGGPSNERWIHHRCDKACTVYFLSLTLELKYVKEYYWTVLRGLKKYKSQFLHKEFDYSHISIHNISVFIIKLIYKTLHYIS
jgi:hypothetical protein